MQPSSVECPSSPSVAQEYNWELTECLGELNDSDDTEKFWTDTKTQILNLQRNPDVALL